MQFLTNFVIKVGVKLLKPVDWFSMTGSSDISFIAIACVSFSNYSIPFIHVLNYQAAVYHGSLSIRHNSSRCTKSCFLYQAYSNKQSMPPPVRVLLTYSPGNQFLTQIIERPWSFQLKRKITLEFDSLWQSFLWITINFYIENSSGYFKFFCFVSTTESTRVIFK